MYNLKRSLKTSGSPSWRLGEWNLLTWPSGLHWNSPQGLNISSIRVFDQIRDPEIPISLRPWYIYRVSQSVRARLKSVKGRMQSKCCTIAVIRPSASICFMFSYVNTFIQWRMQLFTIHSEYSSVSNMKYSLQQWVFVYDNFVKYDSWRTVVTNFHQPFPDVQESSLRS